MYLKKVEFLGFKSFAERTVMNFQPGMTAIVGPNGCGKSNIADAVRWVLGEQSAKALRGGKMMDVIFNGADGYKPTNMSEVSLTLSDCEDVLKTDYHEVTITRRLFRSGDSEYYLNKQPCRLKDILRLFMDTGVGRNSYSILEQGKIDQVLSSRPEDRRMVFEEASGITKYKADRREAMRKLEHTEQNLTRLDDVIREVKRRMISLQRQAGKARRYKEIQERLRGRDLWLTRHRLTEMQEAIGEREVKLDDLQKQVSDRREQIENEEAAVAETRSALEQMDKAIADQIEEMVGLKNELNQTRESVRVNRERITEMQSYASRDSKDAEEARERLEQHRSNLEESGSALEEARREKEEASGALEASQAEVTKLDQASEALRQEARQKRSRLGQVESEMDQTRQQIRRFEERERGRLVQQERLRETLAELEDSISAREARVQELDQNLSELRQRDQSLRERVQSGTERQREHGDSLKDQRRELGERDQSVAGLKARLDVLKAQEAEKEEFPAGAQALLSEEEIAGLDRSQILGALAQQVSTGKKYQKALEALLRHHLDAVLVRDAGSLLDVQDALVNGELGAARLLALSGVSAAAPVSPGPGDAFAGLVTCSPDLRSLVDRLFAGVTLVSSLREAGQPGPGQTFVTADGHVAGGLGTLAVQGPEQDASNPLALRARISETEDLLKAESELAEDLRARLEASQGEEAKLQERLKAAREEAQGVSRDVAAREAELRNAKREFEQGTQRMNQCRAQLADMEKTHGASDEDLRRMSEKLEALQGEQETLRSEIETSGHTLETAERDRNQAVSAATELRIRFAEVRQNLEAIERQRQSVGDRIRELETTIQERSQGISTYEERVVKLKEDVEFASKRIEPLETALKEKTDAVETRREDRRTQQFAMHDQEKQMRSKRAELESLMSRASQLDVDLAQRRVRYENAIQRITEAYHVTLPSVFQAEEPEWEQETAPDWEALSQEVEQMKNKLEQMGPVNMVAIEEYQEQEDRYQFLMAQQEDLVKSKEQLMATIMQINETTTEMFNQTFEKVNTNFQEMFKKLFGGGEAFLELVDDGDVLESGIDIVAKPPGKKPQVISLLSGGERTMTAVALLFALYTVKPSPFCILDELDAALDDANIGRFVALVQSFLEDSQFIVITHNQKTIAASDVLYGVTQEHKGVSKVVSVKLTDHDKDPADVARSKQLEPAPA